MMRAATWLNRCPPKYPPIRLPRRIGIHDTPDIAAGRAALWALCDYRVLAVRAGVIWLVPRDEPEWPPFPPDAGDVVERQRQGGRS